MPVANTVAAAEQAAHPATAADSALPLPLRSKTIAVSKDAIEEIAPDPKGEQIAWITGSVCHRLEDPKHNEIYLAGRSSGQVRRLTNNQAIENDLRWSPDGSKIFFHVTAASGAIDGSYRDLQDDCTFSIRQAERSSASAPVFRDRSKTSP